MASLTRESMGSVTCLALLVQPASGQAEPVQSLPDAFHFAAAAPLREGDVFIAGGYSDRNENTAGVWRFR